MRKVNVYQLMLLIAIVVGFSSCSKKDDPIPQPAAKFTYVVDQATKTVTFTYDGLATLPVSAGR